MATDSEREGMESLTCQCGIQEWFPIGFLSEQGKENFKCKACREIVLENKITQKSIGNRKLLTED